MRMAAVVALCAALGPGPLVSFVMAEELQAGANAPAKGAPTVQPAPDTAPPAMSASPKTGDPYAGLPKVVARAVKELEAECRAEDGIPKWLAKSVFGVVDVSPDGRPDYLIDTHDVGCDGGFTPWVGSDGFRYILFISTGPGRWTRAFNRAARGFDIVPARNGKWPQLVVFSHSGHCTRPNPERYMRCTQVFEWERGRLRKTDEEWFTD